jgi:hypothetical protein
MAEPQTSATLTPLTDEERQRRYETLRRKSSLSAIHAEHRNPGLKVRWVRDDKFDVAFHKHMGFEFCKDNPKTPEAQRQIDTVVAISDDGMYRTGDVILMQINRDDYEFYQRENVRRSREMVDAGKKTFRSEAQKMDVPTFERDKAGNIVR